MAGTDPQTPQQEGDEPTLHETLAALFEAAPTLMATPYPQRQKVAEVLADVAMRGLRFYQAHVADVSEQLEG